MRPIVFTYGEASAKLTLFRQGTYALVNVWSETRGQGHASKVMTAVTRYADDHNLTIVLVAQQYGTIDKNALNNDQLEQFYMKHGFQTDFGSRRPRNMTRHPSQNLHIL